MTYRCVAAAALLVLGAVSAEAALTTPKCLVSKRKAWSTRRKCEATEDAKRLQQKPADLIKCARKHEETLVKIDAKAAKAGVACRFRVSSSQTVIDLDTGLMWERKTNDGILCAAQVPSCVERTFTWPDAMSTFVVELNAGSGFAGYTDWRVPTFEELFDVFDCSDGSQACLDLAFGPVLRELYFASTLATPTSVEAVFFSSDPNDGGATATSFSSEYYVRAVRGAL
jgi:hypothetical protein